MKILITGASGVIGTVLMKGLKPNNELQGIDRRQNQTPDIKILDLATAREEEILATLRGQEVIIHLAWNTKEGGTALEPILPENKLMTERILQCALKEKVPRVILASSVHVDFGRIDFVSPQITNDHSILHRVKKITVDDPVYPLGAYGAAKVYMEALGRAYASRKVIEVISVRFGNVTPDNDFGEYPFWLSHRDCCQFVKKCCATPDLGWYSSFFAISANPCNPFDLSDAKHKLEYLPEDASPCPFGLSASE